VLDRDHAKASAVASGIGGIALECDVADAQSAEAAVNAVAEQLGTARILINSAGIVAVRRTLSREGPHPLEEFDRVIRVNLLGSFNMIRLVTHLAQELEPLEGGERGVVVNTASNAAFDGQIGQAAYAASKGGVVGMTLP